MKFINWFYKKFPGKYCWTDCVSWAYASERWNPFKIDRPTGCATESKEHPTKACYCGCWMNGKCWDLLSKEEQEKIKNKK